MMFDSTYIYEVKSIGLSERKGRKPQTLLAAARHNLREIQAENGVDKGKIDPTRMHLNEVLIGSSTAREVVIQANRLFSEAGIDQSKLRKDYNQASEHVFSLRPGQEERGFFRVIAERAIRIFGENKVLSFVVHRDQDQPHAHMLVSPISKGKYMGSKLHMRKALMVLKAEFSESAKTIGFQPAPESKVMRQRLKYMVAKIVAYLEHTNDPLLFHPQWTVILQMIAKDPSPLFQRLNLETMQLPGAMSQGRLVTTRKSSMTGDSKKRCPDHQNLPSVGFRKVRTATEGGHPDRSDCNESQIIRLHDSELPAENFDFETGEFWKPPELLKPEKSKQTSGPILGIPKFTNKN